MMEVLARIAYMKGGGMELNIFRMLCLNRMMGMLMQQHAKITRKPATMFSADNPRPVGGSFDNTRMTDQNQKPDLADFLFQRTKAGRFQQLFCNAYRIRYDL